MKQFLFSFAISLLSCTSMAQECNCNEIAGRVVKKIEANYIARSELIHNKKYQSLKKEIQAKEIPGNVCGAFLYELTKSINDKHVLFYLNNAEQHGFQPQFYNKYIEPRIEKKDFRFVAGVWVVNDIKMQAIKDENADNRYLFFILESASPKWKKGDIRAVFYKYKNSWYADYYRANYNRVTYKPSISKDSIDFEGHFVFYREGLRPSFSVQQEYFISDSVTYSYLRLPSFGIAPEFYDSIINKNLSLISRTPHLVIDLRNNYGGSTRAYRSVLPLLYTNSIRIESSLFSATGDIITERENYLHTRNDTSTISYRHQKDLVSRMKLNIGKKVFDSGYYYTRDTVYQYPDRISVLVNKNTISAAELFLISAKQSKKVTVFGENTAGGGDKLDAHSFSLGYGECVISIPISIRIPESYKKPIDYIGIPPDIRIPGGVDWIDFVLKCWKNHTSR
jgi:Peptidase family S41